LKALIFTEYGPPDVLQIKEVDTPVPKADEVLIKVHAVSINDWENGLSSGKPYFMRYFTGLFKPKPAFQIPGCDVSGHVEKVGSEVTRFQLGDEVYGDLCESGFGSFAEYARAKETSLEFKPAGMTFEQAAAIPQAAQLAIDAIIDIGKLQPGQKLLINGAGGGVGTFGVQFAKEIGAEITVVDLAEKLPILKELGADFVIDYQQDDFAKSKKKYDLIVDTKTSRYPWNCVRALNDSGMYATVGGSMWRIFIALFYWPWLAVTSKKKYRMVVQKPNQGLSLVNKMFEAGKLKPVIDGPFKFIDIVDALKYFATAKHKGKVIVTMIE